VGVLADQSGTISGAIVYCDEHNRLWSPVQADQKAWGICNAACNDLTYAGFSDWVLPTCTSKTADSNCNLWQLAIDACGSYDNCSSPPPDYIGTRNCWSSTAGDVGFHILINSNYGTIYLTQADTYLGSGRCVRGQ